MLISTCRNVLKWRCGMDKQTHIPAQCYCSVTCSKKESGSLHLACRTKELFYSFLTMSCGMDSLEVNNQKSLIDVKNMHIFLLIKLYCENTQYSLCKGFVSFIWMQKIISMLKINLQTNLDKIIRETVDLQMIGLSKMKRKHLLKTRVWTSYGYEAQFSLELWLLLSVRSTCMGMWMTSECFQNNWIRQTYWPLTLLKLIFDLARALRLGEHTPQPNCLGKKWLGGGSLF